MVYPEIPDTYWSFKYTLPFIGKKSAFPPLGLMTVASLLPDSYEPKLIDMNVAPITEVDLRTIGDGNTGPISAKLQELFNGVALGRNPKYSDWYTFVKPE